MFNRIYNCAQSIDLSIEQLPNFQEKIDRKTLPKKIAPLAKPATQNYVTIQKEIKDQTSYDFTPSIMKKTNKQDGFNQKIDKEPQLKHSPSGLRKNDVESFQKMDQSMKFQVDEHDLNCIVCLEIPTTAYTSECCGTLVCEKCKLNLSQQNLNKCPQCRNSSPNFQKNVYAMKLINSIPSVCKNKCGYTSSAIEMNKHNKMCPQRVIKCCLCQFEAKRSEFLAHVNKNHEDDIIQLLEQQSNPNIDQY